MSVAPSRSNSRMQQFEDSAHDEDLHNGIEGAVNGGGNIGGGGGVAEPTSTTPRAEKAVNPISTSGASGKNAANKTESDEEEYEEEREPPRVNLAPNGGGGGYWRQGAASRPSSPGATTMADNASEASSMMPPPRPKSRVELATSRYGNLSYWRALRVIFYKNGDPFFPGIEFRFKPGRDIGTLDSLLDKLSLRMDLPRGARYIFSMDGDRKFRLEELEDGASYVVSSYKTFKVYLIFKSLACCFLVFLSSSPACTISKKKYICCTYFYIAINGTYLKIRI